MIAGEVDAVHIPQGCLDVLAQQIVGAVAARRWGTDELFVLIRRAYPYRELSRDLFDAVLGMLAGEHAFQMARAPRLVRSRSDGGWARADERSRLDLGIPACCRGWGRSITSVPTRRPRWWTTSGNSRWRLVWSPTSDVCWSSRGAMNWGV